MSILPKFLTLKWNISRTIWRIEVSDGSSFCIFHALSFGLNFFFDQRFPLIQSSQASARSSIIAAQLAFLNNFEDIVNRRVNIQEDIKHYQDTLSYASSKVDCSVGENIYMLPSDMNLKIRLETVGYNNKILISHEKSSLGKNEKVGSLETPATQTDYSHEEKHMHQLLLIKPGTPDYNPQQGKNFYGTFSGKWFCNMEYV